MIQTVNMLSGCLIIFSATQNNLKWCNFQGLSFFIYILYWLSTLYHIIIISTNNIKTFFYFVLTPSRPLLSDNTVLYVPFWVYFPLVLFCSCSVVLQLHCQGWTAHKRRAKKTVSFLKILLIFLIIAVWVQTFGFFYNFDQLDD